MFGYLKSQLGVIVYYTPRDESMALPPGFKIVFVPRAREKRTRCNAILFLIGAYIVFSHFRIESFVQLFII